MKNRLVKNLILKKQLLEAGDLNHKKIRPLLLICGGGMRGVYGAGSAIALNLLGLDEVFDHVIGVSAGAAIGAYFLSKQTLTGASVFYEICATKRFIDYLRLRQIADIDYLETCCRHKYKLSADSLLNSRSEFYVGTTKAEHHDGMLIDVKTAKPDPISAIKASIAVPGLYKKTINVNGKELLDGGIALPCPVKEIISRFKPTDILVITNLPSINGYLLKERVLEKILSSLTLRGYPEGLVKKILSCRQRLTDAIRYLPCVDGINSKIIWAPDYNIHALTQNPAKLRAAVANSVNATLDEFESQKIPFQLL